MRHTTQKRKRARGVIAVAAAQRVHQRRRARARRQQLRRVVGGDERGEAHVREAQARHQVNDVRPQRGGRVHVARLAVQAAAVEHHGLHVGQRGSHRAARGAGRGAGSALQMAC